MRKDCRNYASKSFIAFTTAREKSLLERTKSLAKFINILLLSSFYQTPFESGRFLMQTFMANFYSQLNAMRKL